MRKVAEITTPKRGRPPKKQLITPKSAPAATREASPAPQNGAKLSDTQAPSKQTNSSGSQRKDLSVNKRSGSRSASLDSSGSLTKKKRQKSPDKASVPSGKTSTPSSRASSKEKVETLLSKTVKHEALKVAQRLESTAKRISMRGKPQGGQTTQKRKTLARKKQLRRSEPVKELKTDTDKIEIKRLSTTDGFWSSKTSSRSNSPLGQLLEPASQKQAHPVKKDSRTSTPDISPSSTKRQSITKTRSDKEEATAAKPNIPVSELRRLRTTEGFSFVTPIADSRDASPSSAVSLDRAIRQNARPLNRSSENKIGTKSCDIDRNSVVNDTVQGKARMKNKKALNDVSDQVSEVHMETSETSTLSSSTLSSVQTGIESPVSRFQKKKKSDSEHPAKQDKHSLHAGGRKASFMRVFNKRQKLKITSVLPYSVIGESSIDQETLTSITTAKVQGKARLTRRSTIKRIIKNSPKKGKGGGLKQVKHKLKDIGSLEFQKSLVDVDGGDLNTQEVAGELEMSDADCSVKASSSPEFAISDLLDSVELKRLNTTAGFWASTPDIGVVLGMSYPRRLRDTDSSSIKGSNDQSTPKQSEQPKELPKVKTSPVKAQSTLLQHRKKRLQALQNSLRKIKQQISADEIADQHKMLANTSTAAASEEKPDHTTLINSKKRNYKTRSRLSNDEVLDIMHVAKEPSESVETQADIPDSPWPVGLNMDAIKTHEKSELRNNKKSPNLSSPETSMSVTDLLPSKKPFVKTWKRGRTKVTTGATKLSPNPSSIKTRGRGKVNSSATSLEVLQNLEPNREDQLFSALHDTSKVAREKTKVKRPKKKSLSESSNMLDIDVIDNLSSPQGTEAPQAIDLEHKDIDMVHQSCSIIASLKTDDEQAAKHAILSRQNSGLKKDNLFESLAYDLLMPSDVPSMNVSNDVSVASVSDESVDSHVAKSELSLLANSFDQSLHGVSTLETGALAVTEPDSNITLAGESGNFNAPDTQVVIVNKESLKDIPVQPNSISLSPSHSLDAAMLKFQTLDESLDLETTGQNVPAPETKNNISVAGEIASECDSFPDHVKELVPFETTFVSKNDNSPPAELDTCNIVSHLVDKTGMEIDGATYSLESSTLGKDSSVEVKESFSEIEQIIATEDSSVNHHISVENESTKCVEVTKRDLGVENVSHEDITKVTDICNFTKDLNQLENYQCMTADNNHCLMGEEEKPETAVGETFDLKCDEPDETLNSSTEILIDRLSALPVSADPKCSESSVVDSSVAPLGLSYDGDITALHTAQPSVEKACGKRGRKRTKQAAKFTTQELNVNTDVVSLPVVESQVAASTLKEPEVVAAIENRIVNTLPDKEQLKRQRKRRRNAWKRGVLKKASNLSRKTSKQIWLVSSEKRPTPAASEASLGEGASIAAVGVHDENSEHQQVEGYSPAVKKSLSNMLKKLQTNANLANTVFIEKQPYKGRFLRNVKPQEQKEKQLKLKRRKLNADSSTQPNIDSLVSLSGDSTEKLHIEIPQDLIASGTIKKKRGRPKKQRVESLSKFESFPKLTPLHNLPTLRPGTPWNSTPPNLSPQTMASQASTFFDMAELKNTPDVEFVCESVDDTDLHLYLSGVSDEEQSPKKELHPASDLESRADTPVGQEKKCDTSELKTIKESPLNTEEPPASEKSVQISVPELKEMVKPKFKGRKGRPPGIPMTEEEKRQKVQKVLLSQVVSEEQDLAELLGASQKSTIRPDICAPPVFIGKIVTPTAKFSLRKKSTRSPLEMLAMKRKEEEARYDLEQEKRQARLIHLREMRSARESGDGFSDDGDGDGGNPENLSLCSVVLSDFVKKLQLDDIEATSFEDASHQPAENLSASEERLEYNGDEEDWCADLEEHGSGDRNDSRPYIPRLKLKRIIKKGILSQSQKTDLKKQQPNERHEPIKLVIKTEPSSEQSEQIAVKSSLFVDSAKLDRPSFGNSYVNFLREKNELEKIGTPKRRHSISRHTHTETNKLNATDINSDEILTLPVPGARNSSIGVGQNLLIDINRRAFADGHQPTSSLVSAVAPTPHFSSVDTTTTNADKQSRADHVEALKRLSSGDEEDDDILILDLDDGVGDQYSEDTSRYNMPTLSDGPSSVVPGGNSSFRDSEIVSKEIDNTFLGLPPSEGKSAGNEVRRATFRSHSNDEMGLMFESYNSDKDEAVGNGPYVEKNLAVGSASSEKSGSSSESLRVTPIQEISHSVSSILMESDSAKINHAMNIQQPQLIANTAGDILSSPETNANDSSRVLDGDATNDILNVGHSDRQIEAPMIEQLERADKAKEQSLVEKVGQNSEDDTSEERSNFHHSESLTATSEKTAGDGIPDIATLDNNNVTQAFKPSPKASVAVKKPGVTSDTSKSPKHSTYYDSGPEEWKVKVILHSDKFPTGKYSCKRCGFTTPSKLTIESHIYSHIPGVQFRCAYCESEFSSMAATSSHLKNTHSLNEAKLHISRHIDEKNFYDKEAAIYSEENSQHSIAACANTISGGQSPPLIISVVVSGGVGNSRGGRPTAPPRRFVCTHCGFSTNVKEDAEHHVLDLHSSQSLFACLLCSENVCYTEREIKDHSATVHPARHLPYRKLPDFYDAEQLNLKDKAASQDDRENIFERMTSMFQDDSQTGTSAIDHRQKAKEYLFLQEGWREKTRVEADSTTAVDYTEEQSAPQTPTQDFSIDEGIHQVDVAENEASDQERTASKALDTAAGSVGLAKADAQSDDASITSSAGSVITISSVNSQVVNSGVPPEHPGAQVVESKEETIRKPDELACHSHLEVEDQNPEICEDNDDSEGMGLKIIQVVSLSGQEEDIVDEQISREQPQPEEVDTEVPAESDGTYQIVARPSESQTATTANAQELIASKHPSASTEEAGAQKDIQTQDTVEKQTTSSPTVTATEIPAASASTASSSAVNSSFAGGLPLSYKCNACKVHTPYLLMMVKHLKDRHPNMRCFSCPYCKTSHSFVSQKQLRHHVKQSHPNKFGRNEIALSEDAKKFVEAMVLPMGPECIRVGSRIVLEEDIHTCTYCQVKMISLANVYEHLNTKHSDLFEFVCPVCQIFKSKKLTEISEHCLSTHKSSLETDKVHVSVPKNLFTALTCISKNGKYIGKNLISGAVPGNVDKTPTTSLSAAPSEQSQKTQPASGKMSLALGATALESVPPTAAHSPLRLTSSASTTPAGAAVVSAAQTNQPIFAAPIMTAGVPVTRTVVAFSSSLFDTSTLAATPQLTVAAQSSPVFQNAAASSFLSPLPQPAHANSSNTHTQPSKPPPPLHLHARPNERAHAPAKNLPVLNVPMIKPRASSLTTKSPATGRKSHDHSVADKVPKGTVSTSSSIASLLTTSTSPAALRPPSSSSSCLDNLPDDEPNPDAFKIFNLRPSISHTSSSASPTVSPGVTTVFPPSSPITSAYLQGPIAAFPPGMVIPPNLLSLSFSPQHQPLMQGMLAQTHNQRSSPLSRHPRMPYPSPVSMRAQSPPTVRSIITQHEPTTAQAVYFKKQQQQRELYHLKKQHQLLRQNQQHAVPRAHQQPPSLSGQVYQPLPISPLSFDQLSHPGHGDFSQSSMYLSPVLISSTSTVPSSSAPSLSMAHSSSPSRPSKGVHKRSSSLYQCPYCPVLVTLRALEVASHIQLNHPGKQVAFRKIA